MILSEALREEIVAERQRKEALLKEEALEARLVAQIEAGEGAVENILFFMAPAKFDPCLQALLREIRRAFKVNNVTLQARYLRFLIELTLGLRSFLPRWNLQNEERHGDTALSSLQVESAADQVQSLGAELAAQVPLVAEQLLAELRAETAARLTAEQAMDPEGEAAVLVGKSVDEYLTHLSRELSHSHLRCISEMRLAGETLTEISNDYAAFLPYALYLGASFVTCNPFLVDRAWVAEPERWNPVVDGILAENPHADQDALARLVTLEIVLANMRLLRPIFLLSEGRMGCVCLQVSPHKHGHAAAMVSDALLIYEKMQHKLGGGVPNVVFKLPGTQAGLEACRALNAKGIGTTITVNFGMFQHLPFAQAIWDGQAIFGCLVEMCGRLAYPVRDDLLSRLDTLNAYGIDEARAREAAAWAGVAVAKRLYKLLSEKGYDLHRVKPLIASHRIYTGNGYENLPNVLPDITEVLGASIISVFPSIRRPFDQQPEVELDARRIVRPVPDDILAVLAHSEVFKQAYYVADRAWLAEEDERFRPEQELRLEDEAGTAGWTPVQNTLREFCTSYDTFVERICERKHMQHSK